MMTIIIIIIIIVTNNNNRDRKSRFKSKIGEVKEIFHDPIINRDKQTEFFMIQEIIFLNQRKTIISH